MLGAMLLSAPVVDEMVRELVPSDFYGPAHQACFSAMLELHSQGSRVDTITVADIMRRNETLDLLGGPAALTSLQLDVPAISSAPRYSQIVRREAAARRLDGAAAEAREALEKGADPTDVVDGLKDTFTGLDRGSSALPAQLKTYGSIAESSDEDSPWVIPGLLYADTAIVLVSTEGSGKSMVRRQLGGCASQGIHPFRAPDRIEPITVLDIDCENPLRELRTTSARIRRAVATMNEGDFDDDSWQIYHRKAGINLRNRVDRMELETVLRHVRPQLVVGGPIYRMLGKKQRGEDWDDQAIEAQLILDDLRLRYGFALVLEAHTAKGGRDDGPLEPKGSQLWMAWPDIGMGLRRSGDRTLTVEYNRGNRGQFDWPASLSRGHAEMLPWTAQYPTPERIR